MASVPGKNLNQENIIRKVFDNSNDSLRVNLGSFSGNVTISHLDDDIAIADRNSSNFLKINSNGSLDTNLVGVVPVSGRLPVDVGSLNVTIDNAQLEIANDVGNPIPISDAGGSITVDATNFGIRNLLFATDKVDVSNSTIALDSATLAALENTTVTVSNAIDLSATTLAALENININNFPVNQAVTISNSSLAVTGNWLTDTELRASDVNVSVSNFPSIQNVSATNLDIRDLVFATDKVDVSNSVVALDSATLAALENTTVTVSNFPVTQPVSGTVALDTATLNALENINVNNFPVNQDVTITNASIAVTGTVSATQSGTWNINNISGAISLPTGAATETTLSSVNNHLATLETNQVNGSQLTIVRGGTKGATVDGDITSTDLGPDRQALDVAIRQDLPLQFSVDKVDVTGSVVDLSATTLAALENITVTVDNEVEIKNDANNPVPMSVASLPLPTGAATSALQTTANSSLASIDTKLTSPLSTNITSDNTRELGRILASDSLYVSETFNTTSNIYASARPVNGNLDVRRYKTKTIFVQNTSANNGRVTITGSIDGGLNFDVPILGDTALNAGVTNVTNTELPVTNIRITVRSQTNGQSTSFISKAYAIGV